MAKMYKTDYAHHEDFNKIVKQKRSGKGKTLCHVVHAWPDQTTERAVLLSDGRKNKVWFGRRAIADMKFKSEVDSGVLVKAFALKGKTIDYNKQYEVWV